MVVLLRTLFASLCEPAMRSLIERSGVPDLVVRARRA
jgi:hypothetical protein